VVAAIFLIGTILSMVWICLCCFGNSSASYDATVTTDNQVKKQGEYSNVLSPTTKKPPIFCSLIENIGNDDSKDHSAMEQIKEEDDKPFLGSAPNPFDDNHNRRVSKQIKEPSFQASKDPTQKIALHH